MDCCPKCNECSCECKLAPRGPRGYQGPSGEQGPPGVRGELGSQGSRGKRGPKGIVGDRGPEGAKGKQGATGPKGGPRGKRGHTGPKGEKGPAGTLDSAYGFAYSELASVTSGEVKFIIAGPLQDVELIREGLKVSKAGVYQVNYKVILESKDITSIPSRFQIQINDASKASSLTESMLSSTLTSTNLFSLLEGDVVKLVADLQECFSYKLVTLQIIQVG